MANPIPYSPDVIARSLMLNHPQLLPAVRWYADIARKLPAGRYQQLEGIARDLVERARRSPSPAVWQLQSQLQAAITSAVPPGIAGGPDDLLMEMAFIVLMTAVNNIDKDLEMQMAAIEALTAAKALARDLLQKVEQLQASLAGKTVDSFQQVVTWIAMQPDWPRPKP